MVAWCSQSSRFPTAGQGERSSGNEIGDQDFREGLPVSRRMRGWVYMASRDKVDVDKFHKGIQYALKKL